MTDCSVLFVQIALNTLLSCSYLSGPKSDRIRELLTRCETSPVVLNFSSRKRSLAGTDSQKQQLLVHNEPTEFAQVGLSEERFPAFSAVTEHVNACLSNVQNLLGFKSTAAPLAEKLSDQLDAEKARRTSVTIGGIVYLAVVVASFVSYSQQSV